MKINYFVLIVFLVFTFIKVTGQEEVRSFITSESYFENPELYLSKLDKSKITTGILIDKIVEPTENFFEYNGISKVKNGSYFYWRHIYTSLMNARIEQTPYTDIEELNDIAISVTRGNNHHLVGVINIDYNVIKPSAIVNGEFIEVNGFLIDSHSTKESYDKHRVVASSVFASNVFGDRVTFLFPSVLYYSNTNEELLDIQADFGNGYVNIEFDSPIDVDFSSESSHELVKIKLQVKDNRTDEIKTLYSHFDFLRISSTTIPFVNSNESRLKSVKNYTNDLPKVREPNYIDFYPKSYTIERCTIPIKNPLSNPLKKGGDIILLPVCFDEIVNVESHIKYYILYSDTDSKVKKKLKRPIIITDGFDPGNKRDFFKNNIVEDSNLPYNNDGRGLYHLIDGQPSPWYSEDAKSPVLITSLRSAGYDIVIVDFLDGAGDIFKNASAFKYFISNVINGSDFRDENTEDLIIIGPSMGGLITRLAIYEMENDKIDHKIKLWFSFDSPQQGAYIPIALQHGLVFLKGLDTGSSATLPLGLLTGFPGMSYEYYNRVVKNLKKAKSDALKSLSMLDTDAAKQMLIMHHNDRPSYVDEITPFYKKIAQRGYPDLTTNYAITNGTNKKRLYDYPTQVIDFKIDFKIKSTYFSGYGLDGSKDVQTVIDGKRKDGNFKRDTNNPVNLENSYGGWHSGLYSLNCNLGNANKKSDINIPFTRATFIPTASAFGVKVTNDNVGKDWENYATCNEISSKKIPTPFDKLRGMDSDDPEEHVTISGKTATYLLTELKENMIEYTYPPIRRNKISQLSVKGVRLFRAVESLTFAGDGNTVTIESGSKVKAEASNSITFKPGFTAKAGSEFTASIKNVTYNSQLKSFASHNYKPVDYSKQSPYLDQVFDYSENEVPSLNTNFEVEVFPNPVKNFIHLKFKGGDMDKFYSIKIFNLSGSLLYKGSSIGSDEYTIDAIHIPNGVFLLKVNNKTHELLTKIVKQ